MNNSYVLYLQCVYSREDYEAETARLRDLSVSYEEINSSSLALNYRWESGLSSLLMAKGYDGTDLPSLRQKLLPDSVSFSYPAYIAVCGDSGSSLEYA